MNRFCLFLLLLLTAQTTTAQQLVFSSISDRYTLPSKECYGIMQDSMGYIWIATELGLCRLSGGGTKVFDRSNGLAEAAIYAMAEGSDHGIWMLSATNRVLVYSRGKLREHPLSGPYQRSIDKLQVSYAINFGPGGNPYLNSSSESFLIDKKKGQLTRLQSAGQQGDSLVLQLSAGKLIPIINSTSKFSNRINIRIMGGKKQLRFTLENNKKIKALLYRVAVASTKHNSYFSFNGKLIRVAPDLSYKILDIGQPIISLYADREDGLWIGTLKGGLRYYPSGDIDQRPIISLSPYSVSGVLEDNEHNIWANTLEKGTFLSRSKQLLSYANSQRFARPLNFIDNSPEMSFSGKLSKNITYLSYALEQRPSAADSRLLGTSPWLIISQSSGMNLVPSGPTGGANKKDSGAKLGLFTYQRSISPGGIQYYIGYSGILKVSGGNAEQLLPLASPGRSILALDDKNLLYATAAGLYHYHIPSRKSSSIPGVPALVTGISRLSSGKVWAATKGAGLFEINGISAINISTRLHLPSSVIYDLVQDSLKQIWISSNSGLIKLTPTPTGYLTTTYTTLHGLPTNEVYKLAIDNGKLLLSTSEGLAALPLSADLSNHIPPAIYLAQTKLDRRTVSSLSPGNQIPAGKHSISFSFEVPAFKDSRTRILFRLNGTAQPTVNGGTITLDNLSPGSYQLIAYGLNSDNIKSAVPQKISFTIAAPFYQKGWFIACCILITLLVLASLLKTITSRIRKKEREKNRISQLIAESKLTALQAQMNPHFVFNAINSIQHYIISKKEMEAYDYLSKFGRLIRMVLHNSQQRTIPLHEELEMIGLYVSLEQLRFDDSFDLKITIRPDIDPYQVQVPTMLIQPHLENAIWHGLMNLAGERRGTLEIDIKKTQTSLTITICDNGVGRKLAAQYRRNNPHQPAAMEISGQRLDSYNQMFGKENFSQETIDRYDNSGTPTGTTVTLTLPLNL